MANPAIVLATAHKVMHSTHFGEKVKITPQWEMKLMRH